MKEDYILNHYGKNTELSNPEIFFEEDNKEKKQKEMMIDKEESRDLIKSMFVPNKNSFKLIKENKFFFISIALFLFVAIINIVLRKEYLYILGILLSIYVTLLLIPIELKFKNDRYMDVSMWNLNSSFRMVFKSLFGDLVDRINYAKFISYSSVTFLISCGIGSLPLVSFVNLFAFVNLLVAYLICFYNKDIDIIKDSLNSICLISPIIIVGFSFVGGLTIGSSAINLVGYIIWIILVKIKNSLEGYSFREM